MSGNSEPPGPGPLPRDVIRPFPIEKVQQQIAGMLGGVIDALGKDAEQLVQKNGASQTHAHAATRNLTTQLIALLGELVRNSLPESGTTEKSATNPQSDNLSQVP